MAVLINLRAVITSAFVLAFAGIAAVGAPVAAQDKPAVSVAKSPTCGCCSAWVAHMRAAGFTVTTQDMGMGPLVAFKRTHGIAPKYASCHTARVSGYTIEGHVPAEDVMRLLREKPNAIGLAVPGMPIGSPGMEVGTQRDAYDVLLINKDGTTRVFASYGEKQ